MTIRAPRLIAAGALAVAAVAAPLTIAMSSVAGQTVAAPKCLSTVTSQGSDPVCAGTSNGNGINLGTPFGVYGPNGYPGAQGGPLLPGQTWTSGIGSGS